MSDRELEEYIRTIDAKFESHIEKGTIEMTQEYYNLLEERIARLINKNQLLHNNKKKLQEWLQEEYNYYEKWGTVSEISVQNQIKKTQNKIQELEGNNE